MNLFFSPQESPQRKKRKSEAIGTSNQIDLLALGTAVGSILLYSTVKGELHSKLIVSIDVCVCVCILCIKEMGNLIIKDLLKTKQKNAIGSVLWGHFSAPTFKIVNSNIC